VKHRYKFLIICALAGIISSAKIVKACSSTQECGGSSGKSEVTGCSDCGSYCCQTLGTMALYCGGEPSCSGCQNRGTGCDHDMAGGKVINCSVHSDIYCGSCCYTPACSPNCPTQCGQSNGCKGQYCGSGDIHNWSTWNPGCGNSEHHDPCGNSETHCFECSNCAGSTCVGSSCSGNCGSLSGTHCDTPSGSPPLSAGPSSPPDGSSYDNVPSVVLSWPESGIDWNGSGSCGGPSNSDGGYDICIASSDVNARSDNCIERITGVHSPYTYTYSVNPHANAGTYYWSVRGRNGCGAVGPYASTSKWFVLRNTPRVCALTYSHVCTAAAPYQTTVQLSGNAFTTNSDTVRLWVQRADGGAIAANSISYTINGGPSQTATNELTAAECTSTGMAPCSVPNILITFPNNALYYIHCDVPSEPQKCSGNPFCSYESWGGAANCSPWQSCSGSDNARFPAPTVAPVAPTNLNKTQDSADLILAWNPISGSSNPADRDSALINWGNSCSPKTYKVYVDANHDANGYPSNCGYVAAPTPHCTNLPAAPGATINQTNPEPPIEQLPGLPAGVAQYLISIPTLVYGQTYYWTVVANTNNGVTGIDSPLPPPQSFIVRWLPWHQVEGGDAVFYGSMEMTVPTAQTYLKEDTLSGRTGTVYTTGIVTSNHSNLSFSNAGTTDQLVGYVVGPDIMSSRVKAKPENSYLKMSERIKAQVAPFNVGTGSIQLSSQYNLAGSTHNLGSVKVLETSGDVTIAPENLTANQKILLLANGRVTLAATANPGNNRGITTDNFGFLAILASGDITVDDAMGETPQLGDVDVSPDTYTTPHLVGIFYTDGVINLGTAGAGTVGRRPLRIEGSVIGMTGVTLGRKHTDMADNTKPIYYFKFRPDLTVQLQGLGTRMKVIQDLGSP
jgi:hypothetical protein